MKTRMRFFSLTLCLCLLCSLLFCSVVNVSAAIGNSETVLTEDGWVKYTRLNVVQCVYKVNSGQNETTITKNFENIPIPYGPKYVSVDAENSVSGFWITTSMMNVNVDDPTDSTILKVEPGQSAVVSTRYKLWYQYYPSSESLQTIDPSLYECRVYLDDNYTKYISPEVTATSKDGATLYYTLQNNTDKTIELSKVAFGIFDDSDLDVYGFQFYIGVFQYRVFTDTQLAQQAVADSINQQTEELKDSIEHQTEEHRNMFERLGDRISGFFSGLASSIGGFFTQLGDRIKGFFDDLLTGILDGIKKLFIPENDYFTEYFAAWDQWMTDHFGALYYPFDLMLDILNRFLSLDVPDNPTITFPAIVVRDQVLTEAVEVDIRSAFAGDGWLMELMYLHDLYLTVVTVIFVFALANLARKKLNSIMGGGE